MPSCLWILAIISSAAIAMPAEIRLKSATVEAASRNALLEGAILTFLESLRQDMVTGTESIPVLDPLHLERLLVDGSNLGLPGSHLYLQESNIRQLSSFIVEYLSVSSISILPRYRIIMELIIPRLDVESDNYDAYVQALGYTVFGNGKLKVALVEPKIYADIEVGLTISTTGIYIKIRDCIVSFILPGFESKITGLFGNEYASDFVNRFLSYLVPDLVEQYQMDITNFLSRQVMEVGNEILGDFNVIDIIGSTY